MLGIVVSGCINSVQPTAISLPKNDTRITITDSSNSTITLSETPRRIITTNPYSTEFLLDLNAGDKIVGVTKSTKENQELKKYLEHADIIGDNNVIDYEKIVSLHPDIIIVPSTMSPETIEKIRSLNITVAVFDCYYLTSIKSSAEEMGKLVDRQDLADKYLAFFQKYDNLITEKTRDINDNNGTRVYYETHGGGTVGKGSGGYYYLKKLKANNIAGGINISVPTVSSEWIVSQNPDLIIITGNPYDDTKELVERMDNRSGFAEINAVKTGRVYAINPSVLYGPREIIGLLYMGKILYPERFSDVNPDAVLAEYESTFIRVTNRTNVIYPPIIH